jgi:hypothetical protein
MNGSYLGPQFSDDQVEDELKSCGANFKKLTLLKIVLILFIFENLK